MNFYSPIHGCKNDCDLQGYLLLRYVLALTWLLALASGHVILRERNHFLGHNTLYTK